jgi:hypothetical protein
MKMLSEEIQTRVAQACVTIIKPNGVFGRGFLVPGRFVLTAAHCVTIGTEGEMALEEFSAEEVETSDGRIKMATVAVEHVADIAVLGARDEQFYYTDAEAFETWCAQTPSLHLCVDDLPPGEPFTVYIYTHREQWLEARATVVRAEVASVWLEVPGRIEGGTSGSPIVTERGEVIGIVSISAYLPQGGQAVGPQPRPTHALPVWVLQQIQAEQVRQHTEEV